MDMINKFDSYDEWEKIEYLQSIEFINFDSKWILFSKILKDENEFDLVRIEVLKIISIAEKIDIEVKVNLKNDILFVINETSDDDVKEYAVCSLVNFREFEDVINKSKDIMFSQNEDMNLRYSAFDVISNIEDKTKRNEILKTLFNDSLLGKSAYRVVTESN